MSKFILGAKVNMSQVFDEQGAAIPVTVVLAGPVKIVQVKKSEEKDGYRAVKVGYGRKNRGEKFKYLREFKVSGDAVFEIGQELNVSQFAVGDFVDVTGVMKGRGFAGAMKRHGFAGAPASHGHDHPRAVGAIGGRFPQHVVKGRRMAGRMGGTNVTVRNLEVVDVDPARNLIAIKGAVPGANGGLLRIKQALRASRKKQEPKE